MRRISIPDMWGMVPTFIQIEEHNVHIIRVLVPYPCGGIWGRDGGKSCLIDHRGPCFGGKGSRAD